MICIDTEENIDQMVVSDSFLMNVSSENLIEMKKHKNRTYDGNFFYLRARKKWKCSNASVCTTGFYRILIFIESQTTC